LILEQLWHGADNYLVAQDFPSYIEAQNQIGKIRPQSKKSRLLTYLCCSDEVYKNKPEWAKRCIATVAGMGKFSSDRTIHDYAKEIWDLKPCPFPLKDVIYHK
jgi:starch phosphorylase